MGFPTLEREELDLHNFTEGNSMVTQLKTIVKTMSNRHRPDGSANLFLFSMPRSGSTWLMELLWSQPGFKAINEPLDLRLPHVQRSLRTTEWRDLINESATPLLDNYFASIGSGHNHAADPSPFDPFFRARTHRIVFKMIHGGEDRINWFRDSFNAKIVYLIRHPIAVTLSREVYPRLPALLSSDYQRHFTPAQLRFAKNILAVGSKLEQGMVEWCLQNAVPLRDATPDWAIVSYEQTVVDPDSVVSYLVDKIELSAAERMHQRLTVPSASVKGKSDAETQQALANRDHEPTWLVQKWRKKIDDQTERRLMEILDRFELDCYQYGDYMPHPRLMIASAASGAGVEESALSAKLPALA